MEIYREFSFEAAHRLPNVPEGHKCARLHGHSFDVAVAVEGEIGEPTGWIMDFADIDDAFGEVRDALDHRYLNEIDGLENPTSEMIAHWIWDRLEDSLPTLSSITVRETCRSGAILTRSARRSTREEK